MESTVSWPGDESAIVSRAKADPRAFADLYDRYFAPVYNYVRYRVGDPETADDVTAQVFERALSRIGTYDPDKGRFAAWLFTIARNRVSTSLARRRRWRWLSLDVVRGRASDGPAQDDQTIRSETHDRLLAAMRGLSPREREILGLRFAAGFTNREIAVLIGLKETNVGVIVYRSIRRLRAALEVQE